MYKCERILKGETFYNKEDSESIWKEKLLENIPIFCHYLCNSAVLQRKIFEHKHDFHT